MNLVFIVCKREKRGDLNEADIQWGASGNHLPAPVRGELCYQQNLHVTLARSRKAHLSIQNLFAKLVEFCCFNAFCLSPTVKIFSPLLGTREIKFVDYCPFPKSHCNRSWGFKVKNDESCKKKKGSMFSLQEVLTQRVPEKQPVFCPAAAPSGSGTWAQRNLRFDTGSACPWKQGWAWTNQGGFVHQNP